jgi:hypothetical protein
MYSPPSIIDYFALYFGKFCFGNLLWQWHCVNNILLNFLSSFTDFAEISKNIGKIPFPFRHKALWPH